MCGMSILAVVAKHRVPHIRSSHSHADIISHIKPDPIPGFSAALNCSFKARNAFVWDNIDHPSFSRRCLQSIGTSRPNACEAMPTCPSMGCAAMPNAFDMHCRGRQRPWRGFPLMPTFCIPTVSSVDFARARDHPMLAAHASPLPNREAVCCRGCRVCNGSRQPGGCHVRERIACWRQHAAATTHNYSMSGGPNSHTQTG